MPSHSGADTALAPEATQPAAESPAVQPQRSHPDQTSAQGTTVDARPGGQSPDPNHGSDAYRLARPVAALF